MNPTSAQDEPLLGVEDLARLRILVIDDHPGTVRLVADVLRAAGVGAVYTACDGQKGLVGLRSYHPDIVFVDWKMPVLDGLAFTYTVRQASLSKNPHIPNPEVPIIMLTGQRSMRDVETARQIGVNEFVVKPFTPTALLSRIHLILKRPRPFVTVDGFVGPCRRRRIVPAFSGPLRRSEDPELVAQEVERGVNRESISSEIQAMQNLISARGGVDAETLRMTYRVMQQASHRSRRVRDEMLDRASSSLVNYVDRMGGPKSAEPEVIAIHLDAIGHLLALPEDDAKLASAVTRNLERLVSRKLGEADQRLFRREAT